MSIRPEYRAPRADEEDEEEEEEESPAGSALSKSLQTRLLERRTLLLCGMVTEKMSHEAIAQLLVLDGDDPERPIRVYINSGGGALDSGYAIYDVMRFVKAPVHSICTGLAGSAATVILLGADRGHRYTLPSTRFLLHQPSMGVRGQAADVAIGAREILKARQQVNELLAAETGQTVEQIAKDTNRDYWMSAQEAKEYGLIDVIVDSASALD